MLEIMQFYVSGFWVWLGLTIGFWTVGVAFLGATSLAIKTAIAVWKVRSRHSK